MDRPPPLVSQPLPSNRKGEEAKERSLGQWWGMYWSTRLGGKSFYTEPALTFKWSHLPEVGPRPEVSGRRFSSDSVGRCRDWTTMVTTGKPGERSLADVWHNIEKKKIWSSVYRLESHRFIASFGGKKKKSKDILNWAFMAKLSAAVTQNGSGVGQCSLKSPLCPCRLSHTARCYRSWTHVAVFLTVEGDFSMCPLPPSDLSTLDLRAPVGFEFATLEFAPKNSRSHRNGRSSPRDSPLLPVLLVST